MEQDVIRNTERELELMWQAYAEQYRIGNEVVVCAAALLTALHTDESGKKIAEHAKDLALAMKDWCEAAETTLEIK